MQKLCQDYNIPTAEYSTFKDAQAAKAYLQQQRLPIVIKADGLAAGKGVYVALTLSEAEHAVDDLLVHQKFGAAGMQHSINAIVLQRGIFSRVLIH